MACLNTIREGMSERKRGRGRETMLQILNVYTDLVAKIYTPNGNTKQ